MHKDSKGQSYLFAMDRPVILCKRCGRELKGRQSRQEKIGPGCKIKWAKRGKPKQLALKLGKR